MHAVEVTPAFVAVEPVQHDDAQMRREPGEFGGPVAHQAGRHDHQRRPVEAARGFLDDDVRDGLRRLAEPHVVGQEAAEVVGAQMLQPVDALLLVGAQAGGEAGGHRDIRDFGDAAEAGNMGGDGGAVLPAGGDEVLQVEHGRCLGGVQHQFLAGAAACRLDQVVHHRQQAPDALGRQLEDAAILEAGDQLAIDDPRRGDAAALAQADEDRQQRMADPVDLDAEVEREAAMRRIGEAHVARADGADESRTETGVDQAAPTDRLQRRQPLGDEALPALGGVAAAEDEDQPALRRLALGHAHLHEAVLAEGVEDGGLGGAVAADEDGAGRRLRRGRTGGRLRRE